MYTLYLTTRCNLKCSYCYEDYKEFYDIKLKTAYEIIDFIFNNDSSNTINIGFLGGEPLIKFDVLYESVNYINTKYADRKIRYYITTNGTLITRDIAAFLVKNNFDIRISLDGDRESTNINRVNNRGDVYQNVVTNMDMLSNLGCNYSVRMTVARNTIGKISKNIKYLYERFERPIDLQFDLNMVLDELDVEIIKHEIKKLVDYYLYVNYENNKNKLQIDQIDGKYINVISNFENSFGMCNAGISTFNFMPNGDIYPCSFLTNNNRFCIGSIYKGISICKSKTLAIENFEHNKNKCTDCEIKFFCHGMKCGYLNYICTGKINVPSNLTCNIEKIFYKEILRILNCYLEESNSYVSLTKVFRGIIFLVEHENLGFSYLGEKVKKKVMELPNENRSY